jgi:hypothetical protein
MRLTCTAAESAAAATTAADVLARCRAARLLYQRCALMIEPAGRPHIEVSLLVQSREQIERPRLPFLRLRPRSLHRDGTLSSMLSIALALS